MGNAKECKHTDCIEVCNELLRGEISAVEVYDQALAKFEGESEAPTLRKIRDDHFSSVEILRRNVTDMGGSPSEDSGAWGTFAKTLEGSAKLFGEGAAVEILLQGEEYGQGEYEDALNNEDVLEECKEMIRNKLLPKQFKHISILESMNR